MSFTITHQKTNDIPDWTQADLDAQIALGNFPPGTVLADITLPSDWNSNHTLTGSIAWGEITGNLSDQTDLQAALDAKVPGGSDTQIQFNDGGSFGGDADFTWNKTTNALTVNGNLVVGGTLLNQVAVTASTAGSGAPNLITAAQSGTVFTNEGSTAVNYHTLPTAAIGLQYTFIVQDADGLRVTANTGDTIRLGTAVTATAGYIQSTQIGAAVILVAINATEWMATSITGTWTTT